MTITATALALVLRVLAQTAAPLSPPPANADVGPWALYVLLGALFLAVGELWRRRLRDEAEERRTRAATLEAAQAEAASRTALAEALREMTVTNRQVVELVRGCPQRANGRVPHSLEHS